MNSIFTCPPQQWHQEALNHFQLHQTLLQANERKQNFFQSTNTTTKLQAKDITIEFSK